MGMRAGDPYPVDVTRLKPDTFVGDVVTKPAVPPLIEAARRIGCGTSTGGDMFAAVAGLIVDFLLADGPAAERAMTERVDVAVIGSGAAGLVAACRAADGGRSVAVLEKAALLGGTSAVSGGVMWMPDHHLMGECRSPTSRLQEAALAYLTAATGGRVPAERLRWYLATSREAVRWLDEQTLVGLAALPRPDYHTEWPGAARGRGLDIQPFDGTKFPGLTARIRPPTYFPAVTMAERDAMAATGLDTALIARRNAEGTRTMGGALVAGAGRLGRGARGADPGRVRGRGAAARPAAAGGSAARPAP